MRNSTQLNILMILFILFLIGCSGGNSNPVQPIEPEPAQEMSNSPADTTQPDSIDEIPVTEVDEAKTSRALLGQWQVDIDVESLTAEIQPDRTSNQHFNVTQPLIPLQITINSYNDVSKIVNADVTIKNTSPYTGYDVRLIIYTDNIGHMLMNPDALTALYDIPGGFPINPFKAYAKHIPDRKFAGNSQEHTENVEILCPNDNFTIRFAIDASYSGNCEEPYAIENFIQTGDLQNDANIKVDVKDWQDNVNQVELIAPEITGENRIALEHITGDTWGADIINATNAPQGHYSLLTIQATSEDSPGIWLCNVVTLVVQEPSCQLVVGEITGQDQLEEETCENYSVDASGDTGITYQWTCDPEEAGDFTDPTESVAEFCANDLDVETVVTIKVEVDSDNCDPITKQKQVTIVLCQLPDAPEDVLATNGTYEDKVQITWTPVAGATHYKIYRGSDGVIEDEWPEPPYDDTTASQGEHYDYTVSAVNACGEGTQSDPDEGWRDCPVPNVPTGVNATDGECDKVTITWNSVSGANYYHVWRGSTDLGTTENPSMDDNPPSCWTTYTYYVAAGNDCGESAKSSGNSGYMSCVPSVPTGVNATDGECDEVIVSWSQVSHATYYRVWRVTTDLGTTTSFSMDDNPPNCDTTYTYYVSAGNDCGESVKSSGNSGYKKCTPSTPTGVNASDRTSESSIYVSWIEVDHADYYEVYRQGSYRNTVYTNSYTDQSLGYNKSYYYQVKACNNCGCSALSSLDYGYTADCGELLLRSGIQGASLTAIFNKWQALGGSTGVLGCATLEVTEGDPSYYFGTNSDYATFQFGSSINYITSGSQYGSTWAVYGDIYDEWASDGYSNGHMGYPTADRDTYYGPYIFEFQNFEGGEITQGSGYNPFPIRGAIYDYWKERKDIYGAAISGEYDYGIGSKQDFQGSSICHDPVNYLEYDCGDPSGDCIEGDLDLTCWTAWVAQNLYYEGQDVELNCKLWANEVVARADDYAGCPGTGLDYGYEYGTVIPFEDARPGDLLQIGHHNYDPHLHTAIVLDYLGGGIFYVIDSNWNLDEVIHYHNINTNNYDDYDDPRVMRIFCE